MSCFTTEGNESHTEGSNGLAEKATVPRWCQANQSDESHTIPIGNVGRDVAQIYIDIVRHGSSFGMLQIIENYIHLGLEMLVAVKPKDNRVVLVPVAIVGRYRGTINRIISLQIQQPVPSNTHNE